MSEALWDEIERVHEERVGELVVDIERRVETRVWLTLYEELHAAQWREVLRCERQLHLALLRTQRARRRWERLTRHMRILQRSHARANVHPLLRATAHPGLEAIALQEAARRVEASRGTG